ncbi:hypothetical protein KB206_01570 [Microvirga sp. STS02]|uniref:hypothetical protein n=1 Tax=Hymenobacter negativus TaxID=2795026 RepID=UPI0018DB9A58|nr:MULTISPECIES: hypothetical protein [Bacteria]MBH8567555.1 hypothetical protein [Hymenobacter negativus]MBR7207287.1 hypothetical protein [Microvirga sp. STS02]
MELKSTEVLRILRAQNVDALYHANTVSTCGTFLRDGHLLARGIVHERGLDQTDQKSDKIDRELGIWYDIFFDAVDIHVQSGRRSYYGPVMMKFDLSLLEQDWLPKVWVAKSNPIDWKADTPEEKRWFISIKELETSYSKTNFGHHIVLRNIGGSIRLNPYLKEIVLDNPHRTMEITQQRYTLDLVSSSIGAMRASARAGKLLNKGLDTVIRQCLGSCKCASLYKGMTSTEFKKLFLA